MVVQRVHFQQYPQWNEWQQGAGPQILRDVWNTSGKKEAGKVEYRVSVSSFVAIV